jgi:hypothetical protein
MNRLSKIHQAGPRPLPLISDAEKELIKDMGVMYFEFPNKFYTIFL